MTMKTAKKLPFQYIIKHFLVFALGFAFLSILVFHLYIGIILDRHDNTRKIFTNSDRSAKLNIKFEPNIEQSSGLRVNEIETVANETNHVKRDYAKVIDDLQMKSVEKADMHEQMVSKKHETQRKLGKVELIDLSHNITSAIKMEYHKSNRYTQANKNFSHAFKIKIDPNMGSSNDIQLAKIQKLKLIELFDTDKRNEREVYCNGDIEIHNRVMVVFHNVYLDSSYSSIIHIKQPGNVTTATKNYVYKKGLFSLKEPCNVTNIEDILHNHVANSSAYVSQFVEATELRKHKTYQSVPHPNLVVIFSRYDYANVFWTIIDLYDVFIMAKYLKQDPRTITVILADLWPSTNLDQIWKCFHQVKKLNEYGKPVLLSRLTWKYSRKFSPALQVVMMEVPLISEFKQFMLSRHGIRQESTRSCPKRKLNVLFVWRRNYVSHINNPTGMITRKIKNEKEILEGARKAFPEFNITGKQLDRYTISQQLRYVANTDILIGMHGAALAFSPFLQEHSAMVELFPHAYRQTNWHMQKLAEWSGHKYINWRNMDVALEDEVLQYTTVPVSEMTKLLTQAYRAICG